MYELLVIFFILIPSFVIHEYAHAWMAYKLGDPTAKALGRLTLNPIKHMDLFGTILLPAFLAFLRTLGSPLFPIALAKPVPVDFRKLRHPRRGIIFVGMAGPAINLIAAFVVSQAFRLELAPDVVNVIEWVVVINLILAIFNMVPIPPLDGSRLVMGLLPNALAAKYSRIEPFGILIVFILLPTGLFQKVVWPIVESVAKWMGVANI